jgi:hypothetical protein
MRDPFDLNALRVDPADFQPKPARARKWRRQWVKIPWNWVERLQSAKRVSTFKLAFLLLYEHWRIGGRPIVLSNISSQAEGLRRRSKWNALVELETLGLIRIKRRRGRSPRLVLQHLDSTQT